MRKNVLGPNQSGIQRFSAATDVTKSSSDWIEILTVSICSEAAIREALLFAGPSLSWGNLSLMQSIFNQRKKRRMTNRER